LLVIRISKSTSLLHIVNKPLNLNSEGENKIALCKSGVVSSAIVYQLASNAGFSSACLKTKLALLGCHKISGKWKDLSKYE